MPTARAAAAASVCLLIAVAGAAPDASVGDRPGLSGAAGGVAAAEAAAPIAFPMEALVAAAGDRDARGSARVDLGSIAFDLAPTSVGTTAFSNARTVRGSLAGEPGHFVVSEVNGMIAGAIWSDRGVVEIRPAGERFAVRAIDVDRADLPGCMVLADPDAGQGQRADAAGLRGEPEQVIRILVPFTTGGAAQVGGQDSILAFASAAVESANSAYANSQITFDDAGLVQCRLELAGVLITDPSPVTGSSMLGALRSTSDGVMDEIHAVRDATGSDLVALISESGIGVCGVAYLAPESATSGFSLTAQSCAIGNLTFAHEVGHNMGASHDAANAGNGYRPYGFGWRWNTSGGSLRRSVMAYSPGSRRPHFSNPDVFESGGRTGDAAVADNARLIGETFPGIAAFRAGGSGGAGDCDGDGTLDLFQIIDDPALDSDRSGVLDSCELADGLLEDCNNDGIADIGQIAPRTVFAAPEIALAAGAPFTASLAGTPAALSEVTLSVRAVADTGTADEWLEISANGVPLGRVFQFTGSDCDELSEPLEVTLSAAEWNAFGPSVEFEVSLSGAVSPTLCPDGVVAVEAEFNANNPDFDANGDGILDECAPGCSQADVAAPFGVLDLADLVAFVDAFNQGLAGGDFNGDGIYDLQDLSEFVVAFNVGCP